jgi:hypothetical protein
MEKPIKTYIYKECSKYLEQKYNYKEKKNDENFFDFLVYYYDGSNVKNSYFWMLENDIMKEAKEDWQKQILTYYFDDFGEGEIGNREICFYMT